MGTNTDHDFSAPGGLVILFLKAPWAGGVKTRLAASLGAGAARRLYACFVRDTVERLKTLGPPLALWATPPGTDGLFRSWLGDLPVFCQEGEDLGSRMANAFHTAFDSGARRAVLIGSDLPDLPGEFITEGLESLEDHDAAIAPATDGGYYLIGFSRAGFAPGVFQGPSWGTDRVFSQTLERLGNQKIRARVLPAWRDVDTLDDLKNLRALNRETPFARSRTMREIARILP